MVLSSEPGAWQFYPSETYVSVTYEDEVVGFCKPDFAARIVETLNDDERLRKALRMACYDLVSLSGGYSSHVEELITHYMEKTATPSSGIGAIALLLQQRQLELDVSDKEFAHFCDSYRLPQEKLQAIYDGEEIETAMLVPLSRILGRSIDDLIEVLEED